MTYGGVEVYLHAFLTLAFDGGELSNSRPGRLNPGERQLGVHCIGGWGGGGPRAGLEKFPSPGGKRTPAAQPVALSL
jgi:hypothetical protein